MVPRAAHENRPSLLEASEGLGDGIVNALLAAISAVVLVAERA